MVHIRSLFDNLNNIWNYLLFKRLYTCIRADSNLAPNQWQASLQNNAVAQWLGANLESALIYDIGIANYDT